MQTLLTPPTFSLKAHQFSQEITDKDVILRICVSENQIIIHKIPHSRKTGQFRIIQSVSTLNSVS